MDAFISYRHNTGGLYALEIFQFLTGEGLDVFYDKDGLYQFAGEFPEVLKKNILDSDNFILILTDLNIDDYEKSVYIQEISIAIQAQKRIIVVKGNDFKYPPNLHTTIQTLPNKQSLDISDPMYFKKHFFEDLLWKMNPTPKIQEIIRRLTSCSKLESRMKIENRLSLAERLNDEVIAVDMCATACQGFLSHARGQIERLVTKGCKLRILMNHPDCQAAVDAYTNKISGGTMRHRSRIISQAYEDLLDWQHDYPNSFQGKTTDAFLPCAIFIIHKKDPSKDTVKVDYYSFNCQDLDRRSVLISSEDSENFDFYIKQFEWIWERGQLITNIGELK